MSILSGMLPAFFSVYTNWADLSVPPDIILRFIMPMLFSPKKLTRYLDTHHYDVIVTPHLFPAQTLTYIKKKNLLSQKVVAVETDYTCIPFWEETDCDYYIIPHYELIDEFTAKGIPRERLKPYGIPVRPAFSDQSDRQKARVRCGFQRMPRFI